MRKNEDAAKYRNDMIGVASSLYIYKDRVHSLKNYYQISVI